MVTLTIAINQIPDGSYLLIQLNSNFVAPHGVEAAASRFFPRAYKDTPPDLRRLLAGKFKRCPLLVPQRNGGLAFFTDSEHDILSAIEALFNSGARQIAIPSTDLEETKALVLEAIVSLNSNDREGNITVLSI